MDGDLGCEDGVEVNCTLPALSGRETRLLLQVIQRDEQLRKRDQFRVLKLKSELQALRCRGALRPADGGGENARSCARCRAELGRIINRGALCRACRLRVCKACREFGNRTTDWVCIVCQKNMELQAATGEWMNEFMRNRKDVSAAEVIKRTIRRSWTISNPSPRWSEPRNAPEMRAYASLPRHQDEGGGGYSVRKAPLQRNAKSLNTSVDTPDDSNDQIPSPPGTPRSLKAKITRQSQVEDVVEDKTKKIQFVEDMVIPKIEIGASSRDYTIGSPNSSKLRERFSKSRGLRSDAKTLNVDLSKSSDSGLGASRSTEEDSETKISKSDSERSPNFLDAVGFFTRPRSRERSVSSDSSDKNLSDMDKPSIKIRRRHEYSENRDSSSSFEGNIFDVHISNRVRRLHQVALERQSQEESKQKKRTVDFSVEYGSHEDVSSRDSQMPLRKFKSLEREEAEDDDGGRGRRRSRQDRRRSTLKADTSDPLPPTRRLSRRDKRPIKTRRALSECHPDQRTHRASFFRSMTSRRKTEPNARSDFFKWDYSSQDSEVDSLQPTKESFKEFKELKEKPVEKVDIDVQKPIEKKVRGLKYEYIEVGPYLEVVGKIVPLSDDYQLVFISSDSSHKGNPSVSGSESESETDSSKKLVSDCDWDYYDPHSATRPVIRDWNWSSSSKYLSSLERSSPVFSTSDDNSPNFPRRSRFAFIGRDSPVSSEIDQKTSLTEEVPEVPKPVLPWKKEEIPTDDVIAVEESKKGKKGRKKPKRSLKGKEDEVPVVGECSRPAEDQARPPDGAGTHLETVEPEASSESVAHASRPAAVPKSKAKKKKKKSTVDKRAEEIQDNCVTSATAAVASTSSAVPTGTFGIQPQSVVSNANSNIPEGLSFYSPVTDLLPPTGGFPNNFVPIPVPVPIPVLFPVPSAFWANYKQFFYPNFNFGVENFDFRNFHNFYSHMSQNFGVPAEKNEGELAIENVAAWHDSASSPASIVSTDNSQASSNQPVLNDKESGADVKSKSRGKRRKMKKSDPELVNNASSVTETTPVATSTANNDMHEKPNNCADFPRDVFLEGKTFQDVKNSLQHQNVFEMGNQPSVLSPDNVEIAVECQEESEPCNNEALLRIDRMSNCSSSSDSGEDSDFAARKECKKSYYVTVDGVDGKTSDDSDIADVSSVGEDVKSDTEETSHAESTGSEDEGNPDQRFSQIYVVNPAENDNVERQIEVDEVEAPVISNDESGVQLLKLVRLADEYPIDVCEPIGGESIENGVELINHVNIYLEPINNQVTSDLSSQCVILEDASEEIDQDKECKVDELQVLSEDKVPNCITKLESNVLSVEKIEGEPIVVDEQINNEEEILIVEEAGETIGQSLQQCEELNRVKRDVIEEESVNELDNRPEPVSESFTEEDAKEEMTEDDKVALDSLESLPIVQEIAKNVVDADNEGEKAVPCSLRNGVEGEDPSGLRLGVPVTVVAAQPAEDSHVAVPRLPDHDDFGSIFLDTIENRIRELSHLAEEPKYRTLVMITQEQPQPILPLDSPVRVVASDTTKVLNSDDKIEHHDDICLKHANWDSEDTVERHKGLEEYYTMTLENSNVLPSPRKKPNVKNMSLVKEGSEEVQVVTDEKTLSAVICLEEGLADDDSWVDEGELERERENDFVATMTEEDSSSGDDAVIQCTAYSGRDEDLTGYTRAAIDFTLHTIVEESCEDSEVEEKQDLVGKQTRRKDRPLSATELEKYFFFDIGGGNAVPKDVDTFSESSSSIYSETGLNDESSPTGREASEQSQLSTSRLESYFLGFSGDGRSRESDGSVGSDSEGRPSPEQRRKRLYRSRGSNRLHSNSLDNLAQSESEQQEMAIDLEETSSENEEGECSSFEKDGDALKRKKKRKTSGGNAPLVIIEGDKHVVIENEHGKETRDSLTREHRRRERKEEAKDETKDESDEERCKTPQNFVLPELALNREKQQSRDSGFIGSCDDLLKEQKSGDSSGSEGKKTDVPEPETGGKSPKPEVAPRTVNIPNPPRVSTSTPPAVGLTRKDSFNNWSSDEETNLMMSKMRQFFKAMVSGANIPKPAAPPDGSKANKPPQLVYFENELTRLMQTVPGIRDDQVREIVEYLSSEDTWSDSYDSSDYTSSDLEGTYHRSQLQQEISKSCQQIINKFESSGQEERPIAPPRRNNSPMNRDTAFVYQKLVASFSKITNGDETTPPAPHSSPPFFAKAMHHIGSRLVALMHEVSSNSSGEGSLSSHKGRYHKRISQKLSNVSSTTEEDCCLSDNDPDERSPYLLPRSKSHDLLLEEARSKTRSSATDVAEEKEASDYERFSWRGSFESALMAGDSRSKLTLLSSDSHNYASSSTLVAKRRSAGDLLFSMKSLSREQLDRVRSCGSIGGAALEETWAADHRRSSVPDVPGSGASADGDADSSDSELVRERSTLPRSLQSIATPVSSNSLPRLSTSTLGKAQSVQHFLPNVKSARYRPPGFARTVQMSPKRAVSAPGLQLLAGHQRRERRRVVAASAVLDSSVSAEDVNVLDTTASLPGSSKSASPSPIVGSARGRLCRGPSSVGSNEWPTADDDLDRLVQQHSTASLGARSDSMASVYSGAGEGRYGMVAVRGEVEFGMQYNYKAGALEIHVKQCRDLAPVDVKRNRSDPYVKVYLLPDKSKSGKRKTKVRKHTVNPTFEETLKFQIPLNGLETRTLWLTVWHSDMFGRNDFLGEVQIPLEHKVFDDPSPKAYTLQDRTEPFDEVLSYKGEIIIGLKFVPPDVSSLQKKGKRSRGTLHIKVKEAKNLTAVKLNGTCDAFCKSYLLPDRGRNSKQKTSVQRRTCNPTWNYTCCYEDVSLQELSDRCMELTVWDHDRLASNEFLGGLRLSLGTGKHYAKPVDWMDSTGKEVSLWQSMLEKPNLWVEGCIPLRHSLDPPSS